MLTERAEALIRIENLQLHTLSSVFLISAGFQFHILPNQSMKRTEDEQEYRRCSSCKMRLALSMFDESSSSHSYKTCLSCRNKKRQKYYGRINSVLPNSSAGLKRKGARRPKKLVHPPKSGEKQTPSLSISVVASPKTVQTKPPAELPPSRLSAAPVSKWIVVPSNPTTKVFLASVVTSGIYVVRDQR